MSENKDMVKEFTEHLKDVGLTTPEILSIMLTLQFYRSEFDNDALIRVGFSPEEISEAEQVEKEKEAMNIFLERAGYADMVKGIRRDVRLGAYLMLENYLHGEALYAFAKSSAETMMQMHKDAIAASK